MKKIIILMFFVFLIAFASSLQTTIVKTDITLQFNPVGDCITNCTNSTSGNTTTSLCMSVCSGVLKVTGENVLEEFIINNEDWSKVVPNNVIRSLGNETDITSIIAKVDKCMTYEGQLNSCMDSNRNVSVQLLMLKEDAGTKSNYTQCISDKSILENQLSNKEGELSTKKKEIEGLNGKLWIYALIGVLVGGIFMTKVYPKLMNKDIPKDESSTQFHSGGKY